MTDKTRILLVGTVLVDLTSEAGEYQQENSNECP
jgi:hypothetical protein